jgi:AraC-like DNA-binding protein
VREPANEALRAELRRFLERRARERKHAPAPWAHKVAQRLHENSTIRATDLAREANLHPSWLGTAYRRATGEGLLATVARIRVERGARLCARPISLSPTSP